MGKESRIVHMDIARGIGICLVVVGHNPICQSGGWGYAIIFSFHMPLFFFLSGFFHKTYPTLLTDLKFRAEKLLLPYFFTAVVFLTCKGLPNLAKFIAEDAKALLFGIIWGSGGRGSVDRYMYWPPLWFLTSLFVTQVSFSILQKLATWEKVSYSRVIVFVTLFACGLIYLLHGGRGYVTLLGSNLILSECGLPFNIDLVPISVFYYWIGYEVSNSTILDSVLENIRSTNTLLITSVVTFFIVHLLSYNKIHDFHSNGIMDLNYRNFGVIANSMVLSLSGIFGVISFSSLLERISNSLLKQFLVILGQASLSILVFHYFFQKKVLVYFNSGSISVIGILSGVLIPLLLHLYLFPQSSILSRIYSVKPIRI
jgi:fucose 4-O-acetylase-like acetyltransferase